MFASSSHPTRARQGFTVRRSLTTRRQTLIAIREQQRNTACFRVRSFGTQGLLSSRKASLSGLLARAAWDDNRRGHHP